MAGPIQRLRRVFATSMSGRINAVGIAANALAIRLRHTHLVCLAQAT
ncbi:hypothetical protein [Aurantimonas coralicida]|nr:hypothetical protein [Aurantimonas coralicida]MCC4299361.1 hypothetical protein [Aurantimonas coralicida]